MPRRTEQPYLPFEDAAPAARSATPDPRRPAADRLARARLRRAAARGKGLRRAVAPDRTYLVERLAREGQPWINLRVETVRTLALRIVGPELAREGLRLLSRAQALALVEQACARGSRAELVLRRAARPARASTALSSAPSRSSGRRASAPRAPAAAFADPPQGSGSSAASSPATTRRSPRGAPSTRARCCAARPRATAPEPGGARYLSPDDADLPAASGGSSSGSPATGYERLPVDAPESWIGARTAPRSSARPARRTRSARCFRRVLESRIPFDEVEILHTDATIYPALVWELAREHGIPCTFSGGVAATFTRPGPGRARVPRLDRRRLRSRAPAREPRLRRPDLRPPPAEGPDGAEHARPSPALRATRRSAGAGSGTSRPSTGSIAELEAPERPRDATSHARGARRARRAARARRLDEREPRAPSPSAFSSSRQRADAEDATCAPSRRCRRTFVTRVRARGATSTAPAPYRPRETPRESSRCCPRRCCLAGRRRRRASATPSAQLSVEADRARPGPDPRRGLPRGRDSGRAAHLPARPGRGAPSRRATSRTRSCSTTERRQSTRPRAAARDRSGAPPRHRRRAPGTASPACPAP